MSQYVDIDLLSQEIAGVVRSRLLQQIETQGVDGLVQAGTADASRTFTLRLEGFLGPDSSSARRIDLVRLLLATWIQS